MTRFAGILFCAMALFAGVSGAAPTAYDLKVKIEPAAGTVAVRGAVTLQAEGKELQFALHRTFEITSLRINGAPAKYVYQAVEPTPFTPATRNVVVMLPPADGTMRMDIAYSGKLEQLPEWGAKPDQKWAMDDQVNARLVELACYSSWYPQFSPFGQRFRTDLEVSLPKGWTAVSGGTKRDIRSSAGRAVTHWTVEDNFDLVISAAPDFRVVKSSTPAGAIEIYHTQMDGALVAREAQDLASVMTLFRSRLGEGTIPGGAMRHVYAPMKYGQGRAGIARAGLIVTSEGRVLEAMAGNPGYTLFQDIAHEIAHFWWNFGTGQGDWINEAFAEYYSALAVRDLGSPQKFDAVLEGYRKQVSALPPTAPSLATVPREGGNFFVRYYKGSLMLDDVRRIMGDEAFFSAAREFFQTYRNKPTGTAEFRAFWGARLGEKKARLDTWLDNGGGMPPP